MKLLQIAIAALLTGTLFAAETKPAAKKAKPAAKKRVIKRSAASLEKQIAVTTTASNPKFVSRLTAKKSYAEKNAKAIKVLLMGDSITHQWDSKAAAPAWKKYIAPYHALNVGCNGHRVQNTLGIIAQSGILELIDPKVVTVMIGTNNSIRNDYRATAAGIKKLVDTLRARYPEAKILLFAIFPRGKDAADVRRLENEKVNAEIVKLCDGKNVIWVDIRKDFLTPEGVLERAVMGDLLHLTGKGFNIWGKALQPYLEKYAK